LFAHAEALVSPHGAGLTNMLFSRPGLKVVDLVELSMLDVAYIYWTMAEELDHEYWYLVTDPVPRRGYPNDTIVPLEKLAETLERMQLDA
jgi:capsular polysaccharide biosynthesis protein